MKRLFRHSLLPAAFAALFLLPATQAETTDPVGASMTTFKGASDTYFSVPFFRPNVYEGVVESVSGNILTISNANWLNGQFVYGDPNNPDPTLTYGLLIMTGQNEGAFYKISSSSSTSLTVDYLNDDLSGISSEQVDGAGLGDIIQVVPYWNLGDLFASANLPDGTQIFEYDFNSGGKFKSPSVIYTYFSGFDAWSDGVSPVAVDDTALIKHGQGYLLSLPSGSSDVNIVFYGSVAMQNDRKRIKLAGSNEGTDALIGLTSPVPVAIGNAGLGLRNNTQVFVYNNFASGKFKSPTTILTYFSDFDAWSDGVSPNSVSDTFFLEPGFSYILRVPGSSSEEVITASYTPPYLN